jgi:hypothetical protein
MENPVNRLLARWFLVAALSALYLPLSAAQQGADSETKAATAGPPGVDQVVIVVPATSEEASAAILLRGLDEKPIKADLELGLLKSSQQPGLLVHPEFDLVSATQTANENDYVVVLSIRRLVVFGDISVPVSYRGKLVQVLHFSKPGLVARASGEGGLVAREGSPLLIVLENPSAFAYELRARLRFGDTDVCVFRSEFFGDEKDAKPGDEKEAKTSARTCEQYGAWTSFRIPQYAQVTLRAQPDPIWFVDPDRRLAHAGKQKGVLTLRFQSAAGKPIFEQNVPLEARFEPGPGRIFCSLLWVAGWLVLGAILSLVLRVSLPNLKRRRDLKDQLAEIAKATASISNEVDSNLRVLLRVERIALDEIRQGEWSFGPSYAEFAQRVERALPTLKRRLDAVRQLDTTLIRRRLLSEQGGAPTRLDQVDTLVDSISETLMCDQLSEEEWVSVNQRLGAAQKILREPTQTEKDAFDGMLAIRWKNLRAHFGADGALKLPAALAGMESCIPTPSLLPPPEDVDGSAWIKAVGSVRADLQLSALLLLWEFEFLAPANATEGRWADAKGTLTRLLATPALDDLREAKRVLRGLAEGVSEEDIKKDLQSGLARIIMDPAVPRPNQKIRFAVLFRREKLDSAAAREDIVCHWRFEDRHTPSAYQSVLGSRSIKDSTQRRQALEARNTTVLSEEGWYVHHYFEKDVDRSTISVSFYDSAGKPVALQGGDDSAGSRWFRTVQSIHASRRRKEKWGRLVLEVFQMTAALLIPLATLASTTLSGGGSAHWWELVAIGFASDTIKSILVGRQESSSG